MGSNFINAILTKSNLERVELTDASFQSANLQKTDLSQASCFETYFDEANLQKADLTRSSFRGAILRQSNLQEANLQRTDFTKADVSAIQYDYSVGFRKKDLASCRYLGIEIDRSYGSPGFKKFSQDQEYIDKLSQNNRFRYILWWVSCDCGQSITRWALWSVGLAIGFALLFYFMGNSHFNLDYLEWNLSSMTYYSVVTFTTLGFGGIK